MKTLFLLFLILSAISAALALYLTIVQLRLDGKCTAKAKGTVRHYSRQGTDVPKMVYFPVFDFTADGREFGAALAFARIKLADRPEKCGSLYTKSGKLKRTITFVKNEDGIYRTEERFPTGTEGDVFYDPNDPEHCYAIRKIRRHPFLTFQWILTALNLGLTVLLWFLSR